MSHLLFSSTIDDVKHTKSTHYSKLIIQNNMQEDEKDFNYNDLLSEGISVKKMPFINCNRRVFCNSDTDFIDLLEPTNIDIYKDFYGNIDDILTKLYFVRVPLVCLFLMIST